MIWFILGTRPELIKAWPVIEQLHVEQRPVMVVSTGQHTTLADGMPLKADVTLGVPHIEPPDAFVAQAEYELLQWAVKQPRPDWILVQGDTGSALAGACLADWLHVPLCHVEAGLRTGELSDPWPEEGYRMEIDRLAHLKCCPTQGNWANLEQEGLQIGAEITGNTIVDALRMMNVTRTHPEHVLITLHRRESFGRDMHQCILRIAELAHTHSDTRFLWPIHPNPHVHEALDGVMRPANLHIIQPLPYRDFLSALSRAQSVITDSGGVVEECTTLGIPTLVCRDCTERPEAEQADLALLVGKDGRFLADSYQWLPYAQKIPSTVFGDGFAAPKITELLT